MNSHLQDLIATYTARPFETVLAAIAATCTILFVAAVAKSFSDHHTHRSVEKEKRSTVTTATMFLFFFLYLGFLRARLLPLPLTGVALVIQQSFGALFLIFSTTVNILGRKNLGKQWGDQIRLYEDHTFVQTGWYRVVRHPLYASTIWALIAGALLYNNGSALLATTILFIPMMHYRAAQEETLLTAQFPAYADYIKQTGRFFPKIFRRAL